MTVIEHTVEEIYAATQREKAALARELAGDPTCYGMERGGYGCNNPDIQKRRALTNWEMSAILEFGE
jgi:hypothetical protein